MPANIDRIYLKQALRCGNTMLVYGMQPAEKKPALWLLSAE